jgi:hypothetical protein
VQLEIWHYLEFLVRNSRCSIFPPSRLLSHVDLFPEVTLRRMYVLIEESTQDGSLSTLSLSQSFMETGWIFHHFIGTPSPTRTSTQRIEPLVSLYNNENGGESEMKNQIKITRTTNTRMHMPLSLSNSNRSMRMEWLWMRGRCCSCSIVGWSSSCVFNVLDGGYS